MTLRVVATADNHLGHYVARLPLGTLERRRQRIRRALGHVFDAAIAEAAQLLVLAGDLFDSPTPRNPDRIYVARRLAELRQHGIRVVGVGGNHDTPRSSSEEGGHLALRVYAELEALGFFGYLDEDGVIRPTVFEGDGLTVAVGGFTPQLNLPEDADPLEGMTFQSVAADVRLLVLHGSVEGTAPPGATRLIKRESIARLAGRVDVIVVGDIHRAEHFDCGGVRVVIPGSTEQFEFGELGSPGYSLIEIGPGSIAVRHEEIPAQRRVDVTLAATGLDPDDPTGTIVERLRRDADPDALARFAVRGMVPRDVYRRLNPVSIEDVGRRSFFAYDLDLSEMSVQLGLNRNLLWTPRRTMADEVRAVIDYELPLATDSAEQDLLISTKEALLEALAAEGEVATP